MQIRCSHFPPAGQIMGRFSLEMREGIQTKAARHFQEMDWTAQQQLEWSKENVRLVQIEFDRMQDYYIQKGSLKEEEREKLAVADDQVNQLYERTLRKLEALAGKVIRRNNVPMQEVPEVAREFGAQGARLHALLTVHGQYFKDRYPQPILERCGIFLHTCKKQIELMKLVAARGTNSTSKEALLFAIANRIADGKKGFSEFTSEEREFLELINSGRDWETLWMRLSGWAATLSLGIEEYDQIETIKQMTAARSYARAVAWLRKIPSIEFQERFSYWIALEALIKDDKDAAIDILELLGMDVKGIENSPELKQLVMKLLVAVNALHEQLDLLRPETPDEEASLHFNVYQAVIHRQLEDGQRFVAHFLADISEPAIRERLFVELALKLLEGGHTEDVQKVLSIIGGCEIGKVGRDEVLKRLRILSSLHATLTSIPKRNEAEYLRNVSKEYDRYAQELANQDVQLARFVIPRMPDVLFRQASRAELGLSLHRRGQPIPKEYCCFNIQNLNESEIAERLAIITRLASGNVREMVALSAALVEEHTKLDQEAMVAFVKEIKNTLLWVSLEDLRENKKVQQVIDLLRLFPEDSQETTEGLSFQLGHAAIFLAQNSRGEEALQALKVMNKKYSHKLYNLVERVGEELVRNKLYDHALQIGSIQQHAHSGDTIKRIVVVNLFFEENFDKALSLMELQPHFFDLEREHLRIGAADHIKAGWLHACLRSIEEVYERFNHKEQLAFILKIPHAMLRNLLLKKVALSYIGAYDYTTAIKWVESIDSAEMKKYLYTQFRDLPKLEETVASLRAQSIEVTYVLLRRRSEPLVIPPPEASVAEPVAPPPAAPLEENLGAHHEAVAYISHLWNTLSPFRIFSVFTLGLLPLLVYLSMRVYRLFSGVPG